MLGVIYTSGTLVVDTHQLMILSFFFFFFVIHHSYSSACKGTGQVLHCTRFNQRGHCTCSKAWSSLLPWERPSEVRPICRQRWLNLLSGALIVVPELWAMCNLGEDCSAPAAPTDSHAWWSFLRMMPKCFSSELWGFISMTHTLSL